MVVEDIDRRKVVVSSEGLFQGCTGIVDQRQSHFNKAGQLMEELYRIELDEEVLGFYVIYVAEEEFEYV